MLIIIIVTNSIVYAQESSLLILNLNKSIFLPGDMLLVYGKGIPQDSLIVEIINPAGRLVHRAQVDVDVDGTYSRIILTFPKPDDVNFMQGTYTIAARSAVRQDVVQSRLFVFQAQVQEQQPITQQPVQDGLGTSAGISTAPSGAVSGSSIRRLELGLSAPTTVGINEHARVLAKVTLDGILLKGEQSMLQARLIMPDGKVRELQFSAVDDGIFTAEFTSNIPGEHVIVARFAYNELLAYDALSIVVQESPVLTLSNELSRLSSGIENLNARLDSFIKDDASKDERLEDSIARLRDANGQMLALLLPIVGMIAIVVALQATILARKDKQYLSTA
ncbi:MULTISPECIES: hypothetical protein [Candidatus Nitrosocaldus]|jgi:hypothetical protein|uniref:Putative Surface associated S-layer protein n=1 Tax=Candidatus Nitrosocaldus cavascurensis TaxID=2058097 RepID=A0A2K5AP17_9ARCH|nr:MULTISPECIES: hypothetical protein [Candidatus Nitrosocaldus]SPC33388.1 putative Surface associated S-layer protein [Candidatus Nitrosocaldus cavascurensis]